MDRELLEYLQGMENRMDIRFSGLETDISGLKTDVAGLKTDVAGLKTDVTGLKTDMSDVKTDQKSLKETVGGIDTRLKKIEVTIENEVKPAINLIAEGHTILIRKIDEIGSLEKRVETVEDKVSAIEYKVKTTD